MRAAFTDTVSVYANDGAGGVGAFKFSAACRFVIRTHMPSVAPGELAFLAYINWQGAAMSAGTADYRVPGLGDHFTTCDQVELASNPGNFFAVVRTAIILPPFGPSYRRAWVQ
jgi:hypothetical protein